MKSKNGAKKDTLNLCKKYTNTILMDIVNCH